MTDTVESVMALARNMRWFAGVLHGEEDLRAAVERVIAENRTLNEMTQGQTETIAELEERAERAEAERDALRGLLLEALEAEQCLGVNETLVARMKAALGAK